MSTGVPKLRSAVALPLRVEELHSGRYTVRRDDGGAQRNVYVQVEHGIQRERRDEDVGGALRTQVV